MFRIGRAVGLAAVVGTISALSPSAPAAAAQAAHLYIVQGASAGSAAGVVRADGGKVVTELPVVDGVVARLDASTAGRLGAVAGFSVVPDQKVEAMGAGYGTGSGSEPAAAQLARMDLGGHWSPDGGHGVGVALIDTGVAPTPGITDGRLVRSPDFSGSGSTTDGYGHGTFMAGLIAGSGAGGTGAVPGVAPGATLVSVKVAGATGSTTLGDVIEGIGWAVAHQQQYNIRVMSISFGADFPGAAALANPLNEAVDVAWASGITVVAAAGNGGAGQVSSPGNDPHVITVGAETTTGPVQMPVWSGYSGSKPDVLAPGTSVVSLADPGSVIYTDYPSARVGTSYFRGSGTSMSTALTAGVVALLAQDHPGATPDQIKSALIHSSGTPLVGHAGPIDMSAADAAVPSGASGHAVGAGPAAGPLGGAPGHLYPAPGSDQSVSPQGLTWEGLTWEGLTWEGLTWEGLTWEGLTWEGLTWDAEAWG